MAIETELRSLLEALLSIGWDSESKALPGLNEELAAKKLREIPEISGNHDLFSLFSLRNGTKIDTGDDLLSIQFIPGYYLLSLDEAIDHYKSLLNNQVWKRGLFPILADGMGHYIGIDLNSSSKDYCCIFEYIEGYFPIIVYRSLSKLMETNTLSIRRGITTVKNGELHLNEEAYSILAKEVNTDVPFWTESQYA